MNDYNSTTPIAKFARALVVEFGDGWSIDTEASYLHGVFLDGPEVRLYVRDLNYGDRESDLGKIEITGSVPTVIPVGRRNDAARGLDWGHLKVSAARPVDAVRADIERRLLATARAAFAAVLKGETPDAADRAARHAVRDGLATLMPEPRIQPEDDTDTRSNIATYTDTGPGSMLTTSWRINHDGTHLKVTLDGITPTTARQIAALLFPGGRHPQPR